MREGGDGRGAALPGLVERAARVAAAARESGALLPIPTTAVRMRDEGFAFVVHVADSLARKDAARKRAIEGRPDDPAANPFMPPDPRLTVGEAGPRHLVVLNKFSVVEGHLLVVTREFEHQERLLTRGDLRALCACLRGMDGLGFYNGGAVAGASQPHKHLQLVPTSPHLFPLYPPLRRAAREAGGVSRGPLPFEHAVARLPAPPLEDPEKAADVVHGLYLELLEAAGLDAGGPDQSAPYNLLVSRELAVLVPRSREHFGSISLNALAFAGSLFVRDERLLSWLSSEGPMRALRSVALPR
jgi:ATP adenylyltransferase